MRIANLCIACAAILLLCAAPAQAAVFTVDTTSDAALSACTDDPADCSLRGAITSANAAAGADTVAFDIPMSDAGCAPATGVCTITPATGLPALSGGNSALVIDATTQPGWQANTNTPEQGGLNAELKIEISGSGCPACTGFVVTRPGTLLRGLVIHGFSNNIVMETGASGSVVEGCYLGTDVSGTSASLSGSNGIILLGTPGGLAASGVRIGGTLPAQRNLISGHTAEGMRLTGYAIQVLGNLIGTDVTGTVALGNRHGVFAEGGGNAFQYLIGDGTPEGRNLISGNRGNGVNFDTSRSIPTRDTRIQGNYIGTDISGELPLGNLGAGIVQPLQAPSGDATVSVTIGGLLPGQGNRIAFNGGPGISALRPRSAILGNVMFANGGLAIDLIGAAARHPNDADDADVGNNMMSLQNSPDFIAFAPNGASVDLSYGVDSAPANSVYPLHVEFFKADGDEGRDLIGVDEYLEAEAQTVKAITLAVPAGMTLGANDVVVATATDADGNTSEFSFSTATLAIQTPQVLPCVDPDSIFCSGFEVGENGSLRVSVIAIATSGPFAPSGVIDVSDNRGASCSLTLAASVDPLTSEGACVLTGSGAPGPIDITATLSTFRSAFGNLDGGHVGETASFVID